MENPTMSKITPTMPSTQSFDVIENSPQTVIIENTFPIVPVPNCASECEKNQDCCDVEHHHCCSRDHDSCDVPNNTPVHMETPEIKKQTEMDRLTNMLFDTSQSSHCCSHDHECDDCECHDHGCHDHECHDHGCGGCEVPETYETKKRQIELNIQTLKGSKEGSARSEVRAMKRHLDKLEEAMKKGVDFAEFRSKTAENYKNDKNVNMILRRMYNPI